jgi:hypothetical protein
MKAMTALSAKKMGGDTAGVRTLFDLTPAADPSRPDADSFSQALKAAVLKTKGQAEQPSEPRDVKKPFAPEDLAAANIHLSSDVDKTESFGERWRGQNEAALIALVEAANPSTQPQQPPGGDALNGVSQPGVVMAEFAVEAELAIVGPAEKQAFAFQADATPGEALPFANSVPIVQDGRVQADEFIVKSAPDAPPATPGEALPFANSVPIVQDGRVQADEFVVESAPESARESGAVTLARFAEVRVSQGNAQDGIVLRNFHPVPPENVPATPTQPDSVPVLAFLNARTAASANDEALLSEGFWNWSRPGERSDATNIALPKAPFDGVLQQVSSGQQPQPAAAQPVEVGYERLFDQLVQGIRLTQHAEATEIHVHLKPDFLGRLSIRVLADDHGMRIEIRAENEIVRQVMADNQADLHQRLAEKGFAFNQLSILADTGWTSRREPEWPFEPAHTGLETEPETPVEAGVEPVPLARSGTIDYLA